MFDINETIQSQTLGSIESHDRQDLEHYYVKFPNGRVLSILRGPSPITGEWFGNKETGTVETAVLIDDRGNLNWDLPEVPNAQFDLNTEGLLKEIERVAAL